MEVATFSSLLNDLAPGRHGNTEISKRVKQNGYSISERTLRRYRSGEMIPTLSNARAILKSFDFECTDEYLLKCLDLSRDSKPLFDNEEKFKTSISGQITLNGYELNFGQQLSAKEKIEVVENRIAELFQGEKRAISLYVMKLIEKDITENVLRGDE